LFSIIFKINKNATIIWILATVFVKISDTPLQVILDFFVILNYILLLEIHTNWLRKFFSFLPEFWNIVVLALADIATSSFVIAESLLRPKWTLFFQIDLICSEEWVRGHPG
jgi:hypothetical protein